MIFSFLKEIVSKINAWQIRMVALACLVLLVGGGSQALVTAFAASYTPLTAPTVVPAVAGHSDTLPGVHLSCKTVLQQSAHGISIETSSDYSFMLHCIVDNTRKRLTTK